MNRGWFAHPAKSLLVAACWLLLRQSVALPDLLTAAVLGLVLPRLVQPFLGQDPSPRRWGQKGEKKAPGGAGEGQAGR